MQHDKVFALLFFALPIAKEAIENQVFFYCFYLLGLRFIVNVQFELTERV